MTDGRIGVIADDLTGASDIGGILASARVRVTLSVGVPDRPAGDADALIVALKSRSIPAEQAIAQSLMALEWLQAQGVAQVVFKICSTFDSTPAGNIGPVADALLAALGSAGAVVCPAFPANGRTVYQGHLFVGDRLLSESGMERHPLNPITDPDLRRWLSRQTRHGVGHLPLAALRAGNGAAVLAATLAEGRRLVIADAIHDDDLLALGRLVARDPLVVGGSAIARGLVAGRSFPDAARAPGVLAGPGCILAGSCSTATRAQVADHATRHPVLQVSPDDLDAGHTLAFLARHRGDRPLVATSADPDAVAAAHAAHGSEALSSRIDAFFATIATTAALDFAAVVVAGGETSGAVAQAFAPLTCTVGAEIAPGVPTLYPEARAGVPVGLVLKSGNFGGASFFDAALDALEAGR